MPEIAALREAEGITEERVREIVDEIMMQRAGMPFRAEHADTIEHTYNTVQQLINDDILGRVLATNAWLPQNTIVYDQEEYTTESTTAEDLVTYNNLHIPAEAALNISVLCRKTGGAGVAAAAGLKFNDIVVSEAALTNPGPIWLSGTTDQVQAGVSKVYVASRAPSPYRLSGFIEYMWTSPTTSDINRLRFPGTSQMPDNRAVTITKISVRGIVGSGVTLGVRNIVIRREDQG